MFLVGSNDLKFGVKIVRHYALIVFVFYIHLQTNLVTQVRSLFWVCLVTACQHNSFGEMEFHPMTVTK